MNREPNKSYTIPLWSVNHSQERLLMEERSDFIAFRLGYQMQPSAVDPDAMAYKHFSDNQFPDGNVGELDYMDDAKVALMMDFNRHIQTAALGQKMGDKYIVFDEIVTENATTTEQAINIANKLKAWDITHVYLFGDNTSNQRAGSYGRTGKNDWQYVKEVLQGNGITFTPKLRNQNPKRKIRVDKVNGVIYNPATDERSLIINKRCNKLIRDYKESIIGDSGKDLGLKIDNGKIGHISDACDYWIFESESGSRGLIYVL